MNKRYIEPPRQLALSHVKNLGAGVEKRWVFDSECSHNPQGEFKATTKIELGLSKNPGGLYRTHKPSNRLKVLSYFRDNFTLILAILPLFVNIDLT